MMEAAPAGSLFTQRFQIAVRCCSQKLWLKRVILMLLIFIYLKYARIQGLIFRNYLQNKQPACYRKRYRCIDQAGVHGLSFNAPQINIPLCPPSLTHKTHAARGITASSSFSYIIPIGHQGVKNLQYGVIATANGIGALIQRGAWVQEISSLRCEMTTSIRLFFGVWLEGSIEILR